MHACPISVNDACIVYDSSHCVFAHVTPVVPRIQNIRHCYNYNTTHKQTHLKWWTNLDDMPSQLSHSSCVWTVLQQLLMLTPVWLFAAELT